MMINFDYIKDFLIPVVTALAVWFGKDKILHTLNVKREVKSQEAISLENLQKKVDLYQELLADVPEQFKASMTRLREEIENLKTINSDLQEIIKEQQVIITEQKTFIVKQSSSLQYYEKKYGKLSQ